LGAEAWIGLMNFAIEALGVRKGALSANEPMLRVFRKAGMMADGRRSRHVLWENTEIDLIHVAAFRGEWSAAIPVEIEGRSRHLHEMHWAGRPVDSEGNECLGE